MTMRVIITGGTGLIGRALAANLGASGHEVIALTRDPSRAARLPAGVRLERWDACSADGWGALADGAGAIVNLAGENLSAGRWTDTRKARIRRSRVAAGQAVVEAVAAATTKPRVLVQASASGYYGPHGDEVLTEETPPGDDFLALVCREWEASTQAVEAMGVRRAISRTGLVMSVHGGALPLWALPFRFFVGGRLGSGRQWVPWLHLVDEVAALRFLIENEVASGPFNVTAPNPLTNAQFSRVLARTLGRPNLLWVPEFAMEFALGEMSTMMLTGQRLLPARLTALGFTFRYPTLDAALKDLL
ncbi:MAG: TIGR01777 family oxidoreductase [Chloroflexota bacterium]